MDLGQSSARHGALPAPGARSPTACEARRTGAPEAFPRKRPRPLPVRIAVAAALVERDGRALLLRRRDGYAARNVGISLRSGVLEAPAAAREGALSRALGARAFARTVPIAAVRHTVVNRRLEIEVFRGPARTGEPPPAERPAARWFSPPELARAAIPTLTRKIAEAAGFL